MKWYLMHLSHIRVQCAFNYVIKGMMCLFMLMKSVDFPIYSADVVLTHYLLCNNAIVWPKTWAWANAPSFSAQELERRSIERPCGCPIPTAPHRLRMHLSAFWGFIYQLFLLHSTYRPVEVIVLELSFWAEIVHKCKVSCLWLAISARTRWIATKFSSRSPRCRHAVPNDKKEYT